jgi:hypothetical protein
MERPDRAVVGSAWYRCGDQADIRDEFVSPQVVIGDDLVGQSFREEA